MWKILICAAALALPGHGQTEQSDQDSEALRQEIRQARQELRAASHKLERLTKLQLPALNEARRFHFSTGGKRPMVGIIMGNSSAADRGVLLTGVTPDAPADLAGLQSGDLLTRVDDQDLSGPNGLDLAYAMLANLEVGERFEFTYERAGQAHTTTVVVATHEPSLSFSINGNVDWSDFANQPFNFGFSIADENLRFDPDQLRDLADRYRNWALDANQMARFKDLKSLPFVWSRGWAWSGLELTRIDAQLGRYFGAEQGALVLGASNLGASDLQSGDVITAIEGQAVVNPQQVMKQLGNFAAGEQIAARIMRDGKQREVVLIAPESRGSAWSWSGKDQE